MALLATVALGSAVAQAKWVAAPGSPYTAGNEPYSVNPGLFNGDARLDLAVVNGSSSNVHVFLQQPSNGGFALSASSPFNVGSGPNFAGVADFNGDGRQDLAVGNFLSDTVSVMLQQADGSFASEETLNVGDQVGAVTAGDFNGDGRADIVASRWNTGGLQVFFRKGTNDGFASPQSAGTGANPRYVAAGDLNGGAPDLVVANAADNTLTVLLNNGGGSFAAASGSPLPAGTNPQAAVISDLNGDGRGDIAASNFGGTVSVYAQQGDGTFAAVQGSPYDVGGQAQGIAAADFRAVGRNDLAVAVAGTHSVAILRNDGGTFTHSEDIPLAEGDGAFGLAAGAFNDSDSVPDIAVSSVAAGATDPLDVFFNFQPPQATTTDATDVTGTSATLNAVVNPLGSDTDAHFEYGTTTAYGSLAPAGGELAAGSDGTQHAVSRFVGDLALNTTYHYRVVTSNTGGTTVGEDRTFTTLAVPPDSALSGPPQAFLSAPSTVAVGTPTTVSAEGSTPAAGLQYALDLDGSGQFATNLKTEKTLQTTFTVPGDVKVGLRVTDASGRTDEVRRTVHVTAPKLYDVRVSPKEPRPGQAVTFKVRELLDSPAREAAILKPLSAGTLATATFGDGSTPSSVAGGLLIRDRAASMTGNFTHTFDDAGSYRVHLGVDDPYGIEQGINLLLKVNTRPDGYQPAIATPVTTVDQGSCVKFSNGTASQLAVDDRGPVISEDQNPRRYLQIVAPSLSDLTFGGGPNFGEQLFKPNVLVDTLATSTVVAGSPIAHLAFLDAPDLSVTNFTTGFRRAQLRQAEETVTSDGTKACEMQAQITQATADAVINFHKAPYPAGADAGWPVIPACGGKLPMTTYDTDNISFDGVTKKTQTTRHTWFSRNEWDFGDSSSPTGPESYLPSLDVYHPYDHGGTFTVKLKTTFPTDLAGQRAEYLKTCASNPLDPARPDGRFTTRTAELKLRVKARYDRIKSRGLWMTSGAKTFSETDFPNVYESTGPIYVNTRRVGYGWNDARTQWDQNADVSYADGVLVVTPVDKPLQVVADKGEILGAAHLAWQSGGEQVALGDMPLKINGVPGLIIPTAGPGGTHDLGVFNDPPATLTSGAAPAAGKAFHINAAHPILREGNGGTLELNVHLPAPLGPNGGESDETVVRDVKGNGRAVTRGNHTVRGILDNFEVDIPKVELVPDAISFNGGRLSHHAAGKPPWTATGSLTVFGKKVDMSPDSKKEGCPVVGGLGFYDDGGLANAGAVLDGLQIPIPNPPAPNPVTAMSDPALQIVPGTSTHPLDLFGCLSITDYPEHKTFRVTGCAGFLLAGSGVDVPSGEKIPFCPDENGGEGYVLTEHNSTPGPNGRRTVRGTIVRVSGTVGLGPEAYPVARAYIEFRNPPLAVEFKGHFGQDFLGGDLSISADLFGYFRGTDDWAIGGSGGVVQKLICFPNPIPGPSFGDNVCPSADVSAAVSNVGIGACVEIHFIGIGGDVRFADRSIHPHFPGCDQDDLKRDLGISVRRLPRASDLFAKPDDPLAVTSQAASGKVNLEGGVPYTLLVVNGTDHSPVVQVRDPQGKLVLDDNGQSVQGLPDTKAPRAPVDLASQDPALPNYTAPKIPQGILHNDGSDYHDDKVDLRHATLIVLRNPRKGAYTITTKDGSSPITAISHSNGLPLPKIAGGVVTSGAKRMLTLSSKVPAGTTVTLSEEGRNLSHKLATIRGARASRHIRFKPALGPAGKRQIVATLSRNGIALHRMVVGSYRAPAPPKPGPVRGLRARAKGSKLTVSFRKARNAQRYAVVVALRKDIRLIRSVAAKRHRLVLRDPLIRQGATVTVRAIGPMTDAGRAAKARVKAQKVKKPKRFVL